MICNLYTPIYDLNEGKYSFKMVIPENFLNDEIIAIVEKNIDY